MERVVGARRGRPASYLLRITHSLSLLRATSLRPAPIHRNEVANYVRHCATLAKKRERARQAELRSAHIIRGIPLLADYGRQRPRSAAPSERSERGNPRRRSAAGASG